jgi:hypothetical protein
MDTRAGGRVGDGVPIPGAGRPGPGRRPWAVIDMPGLSLPLEAGRTVTAYRAARLGDFRFDGR